MKYLNEYRNINYVNRLIKEIERSITQPWILMEICGGQTHAIMRYGLDQLLPEEIKFVHGPGCPVCVTSLELIDKAITLASSENIIFTSYGDMLRVPGSEKDLFSVRASGGDVRVIYSPLDAIKIAIDNPTKEVIFFAIGFETTAPANAMSVLQAEALGLRNFSLLVSHVRVPPAINMILSSSRNRIQGFLAAGHVCTVMGYKEYIPLSQKYQIPIVVTGFEPVDILQGILQTIILLENGKISVENAYSRVVTFEGNRSAQAVINKVFYECDRNWRGIGLIIGSGWKLQDQYSLYDAEKKFPINSISTKESTLCISGEILLGIKKPNECSAFGTFCTPDHPLGATMVSGEGACSAYYRYRLHPSLRLKDE